MDQKDPPNLVVALDNTFSGVGAELDIHSGRGGGVPLPPSRGHYISTAMSEAISTTLTFATVIVTFGPPHELHELPPAGAAATGGRTKCRGGRGHGCPQPRFHCTPRGAWSPGGIHLKCLQESKKIHAYIHTYMHRYIHTKHTNIVIVIVITTYHAIYWSYRASRTDRWFLTCSILWVPRQREVAHNMTEDPEDQGRRPAMLWGQWQLQVLAALPTATSAGRGIAKGKGQVMAEQRSSTATSEEKSWGGQHHNKQVTIAASFGTSRRG